MKEPEPPAGGTEATLAAVWSEVLRVPAVGRHDSFFQLGGSSVSANRVINRLRDAFGVELSMSGFFAHPTLAALAAWIDAAGLNAGRRSIRAVHPVPREEALPLSFAQERLWFLDRLERQRALYNMAFALRLRSRLGSPVLERALNEIARRHEVLRTVYSGREGGPVQIVEPFVPRPLPVADLRGLSAEARDGEVHHWLAWEESETFDLERGPVLRRTLLRLDEESAVLLLNLHHIAGDGWSIGLLISELADLAEAFSRGLPSPLPELPIQYADFAIWQRQWLTGPVLERQIAWWAEELAGAPTLLELPADRPRPARQSFRGAESPARVPAALTEAVRALARREMASPFMVLLAAFQTLLHRWTGQDDLLVGTPMANRNRPEVQGLIGLFVNTLVLRGRFGEDGASFRQHLRRVRGTAMGAYTHQDVPFERLVEELRVERSLAHNPLFQVVFALQDGAFLERETPGASWSPLPSEGTIAKFDLALHLTDSPGDLSGVVEYATDLFDGVTIDRLTGHFRVLLAGAVAAPDTRLTDLPLLSDGERVQLAAWSRAEVPAEVSDLAGQSWAAPIHRLFERQVERTPEAPAVTFGGETLSYAELNRWANRLAARLRRIGVGPESRVGLLLERSLDLAVGILGIWKAGGAYVPLDPGLPAVRLSWLVEDSFRGLVAPVLVAQKELAEQVATLPLGAARVVWLGEESGDTVEPSTDAEPASLAYLIYTSGTTGRPKAVQVEHGNLAHTLRSAQRAFGFAPGDRMPCLAPFSFDIFLLEMLGPLLAGGTVEIHPLRPTLDVPRLIARLPEMTLLHAVPALMRQVVEGLERQGSRPPLRRVFVGGDAVPADLLVALRESFPQARVTVLYGPTEATIIASAHEATGTETGMVLGRPLPGAILELRDRAGHLVPVGVPGEVWLGGPGVTRGYLHQPELTAERFVAHSGERFYRTGDLGRRLTDGTVEFLGRIDQQVKVRGFRVELGEIEAALLQLGGVRQAAVLARRESATESRLVAYVVADAPSADLVSTLREGLRQRLPEYMVPAAWVLLEALPLTSHGKVDCRALAKIAPEAASGPEHVAPRTPTEEMIAGLWSDLLGVERVGARDDFFQLGGHSLLATRLVARVGDALGVELSLQAVFEAPTLGALAAWIDEALRRGAGLELPPIQRISRDETLPLSFAQERLWFLDRLEPGQTVYNMPFALRLSGALDVAALERSCAEIVSRHEVLRTTFPEIAGTPAQRISPAAPRPLPVADLRALPAERRESEADRLRAEEERRPFDLAHGPVLRTRLLRLEESAAILLIDVHHIASDGWSMAVLTSELMTLLEAFSHGPRGLPSPLPELPVQYADFAVWQRRWLSGEVLERQVSWWKGELSGAPTLLDLPTDRPRPARQSFRGADLPVSVPAETAGAVRALARREGASPFMVLLAAFQTLLQRSTGQDDLLVGTPIANRRRREVEGLIGFFVNTLVMRGRFDEAGADSFRQLLRRARRSALGAYAHQDVPFERLVEELRVERSLAHNPLFQVMFALQDGAPLGRQLPELSWSLLPPRATLSKFDLALDLTETDEGFTGGIEYATDLFDASTIERLAGHFRVLLAGAVAAPDAPLSDLPMLSDEERAQLAAWSRAEEVEAWDAPVHRLFERQVERSPEAPAVTFGEETLSYAELNRRADRLAARLRSLGVGPESRVGLLLERSLDLAVGILGIWKAGGAYVPLDPSLPEARLSYLVEDAFRGLPSPVLLAQKGLETLVAAQPAGAARIVWLGEDSQERLESSEDVEPSTLAYLIYTSGTTGRPKAVQVEHGNLAHTLQSAQRAFGFAPGDRMPCLAPFSFDIFLLEMFGPLLAGGTVEIHPLRPTLDVPRLIAGLPEMTLLHAVPALMRQVVEGLERQGSRPPLRRVFVGGDAVPADLLVAMRGSFPEARVTVLYGPTEATIIASAHQATGTETGMVLGRPLPGAILELRDRAGHLVPVGVPGEVWLGGPGVTRGYLHQPELTAEKFVAPAGEHSEERFYRTGDLGRLLADGTVEFLGRVDQQVKVRGFRVEPGEIEAALLQLGGIRQAAILARRESTTESRLVAYVVPDAPSADLVSTLRDGLRQRLPEYMVPTAWVLLEEMPLTSHGKIDRRALAKIEPEAESGGESVAPRTPTEEMLAGVWAEVLGIPRVGARDNFFALGGHSLLATRVVSRLRDTFGSEVPLRTLFEEPTLAALAERIDALRAEGSGLRMPPIRPVPRPAKVNASTEADFPLSFSQERFWFFEQLEPGSPLYNLTVALGLSGTPSPAVLAASFDEIVRRHEALRTRFLAREGLPFQRVLPHGGPHRGLILPVIDLGGLPTPLREPESRRILQSQERLSFDLARGGLIEVRLIRLEESSWLLLLSLHHIISDAWSNGVLIRELAALYGSFSRGLPSPLPELPVQLADFADWQRRWLSGETLAAEVAHWKRALDGAPKLIGLPTDRPRPAVRSLRGGQRPLALSDALADRLRALSRGGGATLFMTLLSGFLALLWRHTGQEDMLVGTPIAGRNRSETEGLIGCFINTLVLRGGPQGRLSFRELLRQVRATTLDAYLHQDLPLEKVIEALQVQGSVAYNPLIQVMFALQNAPLSELDLAGMKMRLVDSDSEMVTNFDLTFGFTDVLGGVWGACIYRTDLFEEATIERLVGRYLQILEFGVETPDRPLAELPQWAEPARAQVLAAETQGEQTRTRLAAREEKVAEMRSALSDKKRAALAKMIRNRAAAVVEAPPPRVVIPRRPDPESAVLSFAQERLWFLDRYEPGSPLYNITFALRLTGRLDPAALRRGLDEIVRRHEALRTTFAEVDGEARQVIHPARPLPLPVVDLRALPEELREAETQWQVRQEALRPCDLTRGPLFRGTLLRLNKKEDEEEWGVLFTVHHIVSDAWSSGILVRELAALYRALSLGERPTLPELPIQYADFAHWQRQWLTGEVLDRQLSWWKQELAGAPTVLELPTDRPRTANPSSRGGQRAGRFTPAASQAMRALAEREGATLFMVLLAAYQALLFRTTGQDDVLVGSPIANRGRPEVEGLIGFFLNTLVLRARLLRGERGGSTFRELLRRVKASALEAYAHQDVPFERLVEELQVERSLTHNPLFQTMFVLQEGQTGGQIDLPGVVLEPLPLPDGLAKFDLSLGMAEAGDALEGVFEYRTALFDDTTIDRLLAHAVELVTGVAADPDRPLTDLLLLSGPERHQILAEWNDTRTAAPGEALLHERFAAQAARTPDAPALEDADGGRLTYRELDGWAERVAARLRREGVGPEVPVGVFLERSPELVVALLATLKSGGVYLPLDPAYPADRLSLMLEDSGAPVVLTEDRLREILPVSGARPVPIGKPGATEAPDSGRGASPSHPENLAYVLYTSGSTGRPKGVGVDHRTAVAHMETVAGLYDLGPEDRVLQFASPSFDTSLEQILPALLRGATVVLRGRDLWEPSGFLPRVAELGLTVVNPPTAYWHQWVQHQWVQEARSEAVSAPEGLRLRLVIVGGEAMTAEAAKLWERLRLHGVRLLNGYGPTETVVTATLQPVDGATGWSGYVGIGRPLPGRTAIVLDREGDPAPAGVPGELCLGGVVARGYLGRPDLTAERFIPDPFTDPQDGARGGRLYRTGDLVRWQADGTLEFLGRIDQQVKVRGFRIELGEIESVLAQHPEVRAAAVILVQEEGDRRLVACVAGSEISAEELRAHLRSHLPEHMVPAAFVVLEELPLTPNGKVDRRALARLAPSAEGTGAAHVPPRTPTEELLAGLWADLLRVERVGARDDFFDLGGHSLLATRLASRLRSAFGIELPLRTLFEHPTLASQAERIDRELGQGERAEVPPITPRPRESGAPPLSFAQERLWFLDRLEPGSLTYNLPAALRLTGTLDVSALERTFREIVRRHEALRTTFREAGGEPRQIVAPALDPGLPVTDLRALPSRVRQDTAERLRAEWVRPFDLAQGPLVRFGLLRVEDDQWMLLADMHHIVSDGWSLGVLIRETAVLYESFLQGRPSPLSGLPIQYPDFAVWQRRWLSGEVLESQLAWWREELAGAPAVLELPTDRPRPPVRTGRGGVESLGLPEAVSTAVAALGRRENATPFMVLLTAFQSLLYRSTGQPDLPVGTVVANRNRSEIEGLIGFFVNTLVLRGRVDRAGGRRATFTELLSTVRSAALGAYAHQDLPFERLVEELNVARSLSHSPLFQAMFVLQNLPVGDLELTGLRLEPLGGSGAVAKFDLSLTLSHQDSALVGGLEYSLDLFEAPTVRRLLAHFQTLLAGALAEPGQRLSDLPLLTEPERSALLLAAQPGVAPGQTLPELLAAQAAHRPDAPAVEGEDGPALTYRELDEWAGRVAARLRREGVGPEIPVGVFLEQVPELVVALLAVLKSGGAYLPLDPAYPPERLTFMLEDSGAPVVLTLETLVARLPSSPARPVLLRELAQDGERGEGGGSIDPESLAYLIYTSGSTGRPKAVGVSHRAAAEHMAGVARHYGLTERDRVQHFASPSFDTSLEQILPALLSGATVVLRGREIWEPARFSDRVAELGLTVINPPTAYWQQWVQEQERLDTPLPEGLRLVLVGGEAMAAEAASRWVRLPLHGVCLLNAYGPTETVVTATAQEVNAEVASRGGSVGIGRPLAGRTACVLDQDGNLLPMGVPGELCLGGVLARGYLGRPDLTAERFVPDPFATERGGTPGGRLYRTSDLVRLQGDGGLEFLGRVDQQVKIRGFRIELGEIESALAGHPAVREAAVLVAESGGDRRLVACVAGEATADELRLHLRASLPEHMIPAAFVALPALPLTPNGKVDRRALAGLVASAEVEAGAWAAPRTPTEELLAGLWADLLQRGQVGAHDNFFELGGHSLLGTRMVSRLRAAFGIELPLRALFELPVLADLAARIDRERGHGPEVEPPLVPVPRDEAPPLSFAQERLWFLDRLEPESSVYNMPVALRLTGSLDLAALHRTFAEIVRRHESLRTTFRDVGGAPRQIIAPASLPELPVTDLRHLPEAAREAERQVAAEVVRPFDLERGPLLRLGLLRLADDEWLLVVNMHHVVSDGWSMDVLVRETGALYQAFSRGLPSPLPELPIQYADFAVWQRRWLTGEVLDAQLSSWRQELAGAPVLLELPTDRPRPPAQSFQGGIEPLALSASLSRDLQGLARREGATLFMVLLAAFQGLLHRLSGQEDVLVGSPVANRNRSETEGLIGFFVNTLVLRGRFGAPERGPSFREAVARTRRAALDAYAHQDLPFERLVEDLQVERSLSHSPLFQVLFALQNLSLESLELPGLRLGPVPTQGRTAKFDLTLSLAEEEGGVAGTLEYSSELFDATTIRRQVSQLRTLLAAALAEPGRPVSELPLLDDAERFQLIAEWNDTARFHPAAPLVHELVAAQARLRPEATAVVSRQGRLSYGDLVERAHRLARLLRSLGIGPEGRVAVCLERSPERVVAALGVLAAGGSYVSLDPGYPPERLASLLADSRASVLLTGTRRRATLPDTGAVVLCLDDDPDPLAGQTPEPFDSGVTSANPAYVIYTSGSTGQPKGIEVPHAGLLNLVLWHQETYGVTPEDRAAQVASPAFDASVWELWPYLAAGAELHIPDEEIRLAAAATLRWWADEGITLTFLPTPLAEAILEEPAPSGLALRALLIGGDRLHRAPGPEWSFQLVNHYGPAECSVVTTATAIPPSPQGAGITAGITAGIAPPIGRAIHGARVHVLDPAGEPVPIGVPGELHIGGAGLARGYLGRPDLTAAAFLPDAFSGEPGARLYRTGDRVRWRPDGQLDFLGRFDHQVKVRGVRIELGEIEAVLASHPLVQEAAVLVRSERPGDAALIAFLVARGPRPATGDLRGFLQRRLPDAMVPAAFVVLDALPLTPNGKVDRRALAAHQPEVESTAGTLAPPRNPVEEILVGIWADLLQREEIGLHDDFFALGGHSMLATRLVSSVRDVFDVEIPLRRLFEAPTVAGLAAAVEEARAEAAGLPALPLVPRPRLSPPRLSFAQERLWFLDQLDKGASTYSVPLAVRLTGAVDPALFAVCLREIVRRHEVLRTTFAHVSGEPYQVISPTLDLDLPVVDLRGLPADARDRELLHQGNREADRPFDLVHGPLIRPLLLRTGQDEWAALIVLHHIVFDGWSVGVLIRELSVLYAALAAGRPSPLPELPLQYADYAGWQRDRLQGETLQGQIAYWREALAGASGVLELPTDRPRPPVQSSRGATRPLALSAPVTEALRALSRQEGATLFMTLLAAFQTLLHRYTGDPDVLIGSAVANRGQSELEGLIGLFVNSLVLRADFRGTASGEPSFRQVLQRVRAAALGAYTHQELPFEKLVDELGVARSLARHPLYQAVFSLENPPSDALRFSGLTLAPLSVETQSAKLDLQLSLVDAPTPAGTWQYAADLFDAPTIDRLSGHLTTLLAGIADDPDRLVADLPLLTGLEMAQLGAWNDQAGEAPTGLCLHQLFEEQAARAPRAVAAVFGEERLTYGELDRRSDRLALHLTKLGVGVETLVGICLERGLERLVAVLGVLKAGGAYVPLDPSYPRERLAWMLEDSAAPVLITQTGLLPVLPEHRAAVVCLDSTERARTVVRADSARPASPVTPDNLAYVIYTSGSTGRPNGVLVRHGSVVHLIREAIGHFGVDARSRVLQIVSFSFDASVLETWMALASGATLCVSRRAERLSGEALAERIRHDRVTTAVLTPALLGALPDGELPTLRSVSVGGESCPGEIATRWAPPSSLDRLLNCYGPTEATIYASVLSCRGTFLKEPPIGQPIAGVRIDLLDRSGQPVPVGVPGELCIAGEGLARGYLNRPALTAERFLPDPFSTQGGRLYRTGDLARRQPDGTLEFLGRVDRQVKVRGLRIELGEIEAALLRHPAVHECAVVVRGQQEEKQLVAFVTPHPADHGETSETGEARLPAAVELRELLRERLPEYMIPAAFIPMEALPRTPVGKVDRAALGRTEIASTLTGEGGEPRDVLELRLALIWQEVLGVPRIGIRDDFFAVGGYSLLAVSLMAKIHEQLGWELPLTALFQGPTIEALAALLRRGDSLAPSILVPIQPRGSRPPLFCVHPAGGDVLCFAPLARHLGPEQPLYGLQARGLAGEGEPLRSIEEMAALYVSEIRRVQPEGPYRIAGWSLGGLIAFEMARQLRHQGTLVDLLAVLDCTAGMSGGAVEDDLDLISDVISYIESFRGKGLGITREDLAELTPQARLEYLAERLLATDFLPPGVGTEQIARLLAVYRANAGAARAYEPGPYPDRITVLRAREVPAGPDGTPPGLLGEPDLGWGRVSTEPVEVHTTPGTHLTLLVEPNVQELARQLALLLGDPHA